MKILSQSMATPSPISLWFLGGRRTATFLGFARTFSEVGVGVGGSKQKNNGFAGHLCVTMATKHTLFPLTSKAKRRHTESLGWWCVITKLQADYKVSECQLQYVVSTLNWYHSAFVSPALLFWHTCQQTATPWSRTLLKATSKQSKHTVHDKYMCHQVSASSLAAADVSLLLHVMARYHFVTTIKTIILFIKCTWFWSSKMTDNNHADNNDDDDDDDASLFNT